MPPQTVHSKVKVSKNNSHTIVKTSHALSSLLDTSEDEHIESLLMPQSILKFVLSFLGGVLLPAGSATDNLYSNGS